MYAIIIRCKSDLINSMDHMRISGTEPSSVILSQKKVVYKSWKIMYQVK